MEEGAVIERTVGENTEGGGTVRKNLVGEGTFGEGTVDKSTEVGGGRAVEGTVISTLQSFNCRRFVWNYPKICYTLP